MGEELQRERVHPESRRRFFILADGQEAQSKFGFQNDVRDDDGGRGDGDRRIEMLSLVEPGPLHNAISARAPRDRKIRHHHPECFADADGGDGKVRPFQPEGGQPDQQRRSRSRDPREHEREKRMNPIVDGESSGICAEAVKNRKSERDLPGKAAQQIPRHTRRDPSQGHEKEPGDIGTQPNQRQQDQNKQQQKRQDGADAPGERKPACTCGVVHASRCLF